MWRYLLIPVLVLGLQASVKAQYSQLEIKKKDTAKTYLYIFPFLGKTLVNHTSPVAFNAVADLKGYTYGLGTTFAGGLGKYFIVADFTLSLIVA